MSETANLALRSWAEDDLPLLETLLGDPAMTAHLGGPESQEQIARRHQRLLTLTETATDRMFAILRGLERVAVGSIGYWEKHWREQLVYEMGWFILPEYQGRGIATKAGVAAISLMRLEQQHRFVHAFPAVDNLPSNAICRKLGFTLIEECAFEYPPGNFLTVNDWRLDLMEKHEHLAPKLKAEGTT